MPLIVPVSVNYPGPLVSMPDRWPITPPEGPRSVGLYIAWGTMGGGEKSVAVDVGGNAPASISQIVALTVDNSQSGADVSFLFTDIQQTVTVPAYESGTFPVFTAGTAFYISAPSALAIDATSVVVHNVVPPIGSVPKTEFQAVAVVSGAAPTTGTTQIIAAGVTGSISALQVGLAVNATAAWSSDILLQDGNGNNIAYAEADGTGYLTMQMLNLTNMQVRFQNGLKAVVTSTGAPGGAYAINIYYRTP